MINIKKDPFRLFFPVGCVFGLLGNAIWPLFIVKPNLIGFQPLIHKNIMIGGFLTAFVLGFLMTAIPRFTKTGFAKNFELLPAVTFLFISQISILLNQIQFFYLSTFLTYGFLIFFAQKRFRNRKDNPPPTFIFVGLGLLIFLISSFLLSLNLEMTPKAQLFIKALFYQGGILSLVLGIGGRLIPAILGWTDVVSTQAEASERPRPFLKAIPNFVFIVLFLFVLSFFIEHFVQTFLGRSLRAMSITIVAIAYWKLHRQPKETTALTLFLWTSSWFVLVGSWLNSIVPSMHTHGLHLIFIGGFSLMTIMIATRVTLAHGNGEMSVEKKSAFLILPGLLFVFASIARVLTALYPTNYTQNIALSAMIWLVGLLIWSVYFIPKILKAST